MNRTLQIGLGLFVAVWVVHDGFAQTSPARPVSICEIRSQSKRYLGKVVTVTGEVMRTVHDGMSMSSSQCPLIGALLIESNDLEKSHASEAETFRDGTWKTTLCTDDRVFVATVRGRFGTAVARGIPIYRIVVDRVLQAEFTKETSRYCINREPPLPAPAFVVPSKPMPDLSHSPSDW
jgi:hypothetical protein